MDDNPCSGHAPRWGAVIGCTAVLTGLAVAVPTAAVAEELPSTGRRRGGDRRQCRPRLDRNGPGHLRPTRTRTRRGRRTAAGPDRPGSDTTTDLATVEGTLWGDTKADKEALTGRRPPRPAGRRLLYTVTHAIGARQSGSRRTPPAGPSPGRASPSPSWTPASRRCPGLAGKTVQGPDLSLEQNSAEELADDTFGHGTHMAGIIGARDPIAVDPKSGAPRSPSPGVQLGVAPDAQLLALKLATTDGSTDVSQVIAALDWVAQHRTDNGMNVRVVNLSFGTESHPGLPDRPAGGGRRERLAAAASSSWSPAATRARTPAALSNPAIDPYVIAVGASDPNGTALGWTSPVRRRLQQPRHRRARHVDLVAPGRSITSLRAPGLVRRHRAPRGPGRRVTTPAGSSAAAAPRRPPPSSAAPRRWCCRPTRRSRRTRSSTRS